jgi:hypothetical protein
MKLTEQEAQDALQRLDFLRGQHDQHKQFRDELEINHLEGLDDTCRGAKVVIRKSENREYSLYMPYEFVMKWVLEEMVKLATEIESLELKFKSK